MIALQQIPIMEWDDLSPDADGHMLRVPYIDIDEVVSELREIENEFGSMPFLIPPYRENDPTFNARSAAVLWDRLPTYDVFMPVAMEERIKLQDFVVASIKSGYKKFVVPYRYGYNRKYRLEDMMQFLHGRYDDSVWFHVAGGAPEIPDGWDGKWSWSMEEL